MKDNTKYIIIKICLFLTLMGGAGFAIAAAYLYLIGTDILLCLTCGIPAIILLGVSQFFTMKRNKYRDIVEYDENGISIKYGNFSKLSNQERKAIERQKMAMREMLIDSITLRNITHEGAANPEEQLNELIGLDDVKLEVKKMAARMKFEYDKASEKEKRKHTFVPVSTNHFCFMGPPGTGKTTVARIMTGYLYKYHYIKKNQYIEIDGNFFNGSSLGESTQKTEYIISQAKGGVLFIDEAYALLNSYAGQEAIATLIKHMEDDRNKLVVIFAGYEREMEQFINCNSGLESRIKYWLHFKNYKSEELWNIFQFMAKQNGFDVDDYARHPFLKTMLYEIENNANYGNARTVRNVLDKVIDQHAFNLMENRIGYKNKYTLLPDDFSDMKMSETGMNRIQEVSPN